MSNKLINDWPPIKETCFWLHSIAVAISHGCHGTLALNDTDRFKQFSFVQYPQ